MPDAKLDPAATTTGADPNGDPNPPADPDPGDGTIKACGVRDPGSPDGGATTDGHPWC